MSHSPCEDSSQLYNTIISEYFVVVFSMKTAKVLLKSFSCRMNSMSFCGLFLQNCFHRKMSREYQFKMLNNTFTGWPCLLRTQQKQNLHLRIYFSSQFLASSGKGSMARKYFFFFGPGIMHGVLLQSMCINCCLFCIIFKDQQPQQDFHCQ